MKTWKITAVLALGVSMSLAACGGEEAAAGEGAATASGVVAEESTTGKVIEVRMVTDGAENRFEPAQVTASRGDIVRFVLGSGIHNVSFPAQENAGASGLPAPSTFLQAPGDSYDVPVNFAAGTYTFQCDPHVMMGMKGTLTVQ